MSTAFRALLDTNALRSLAMSLVWALYWLRSRRVRETYGYNGFRTPPASAASIVAAA